MNELINVPKNVVRSAVLNGFCNQQKKIYQLT